MMDVRIQLQGMGLPRLEVWASGVGFVVPLGSSIAITRFYYVVLLRFL